MLRTNYQSRDYLVNTGRYYLWIVSLYHRCVRDEIILLEADIRYGCREGV